MAALNIFAGSLAGIASTLVCHPLDTLRTRLQTNHQFTGLRDVFTFTVKTEGVAGLYKGLSAPLAAQAVYKAVIFGANSTMRQWLGGRGGEAGVFACGAISGLVNAAVVTPVELVRSRLMVQYGKAAAAGGSVVHEGPVSVIRHVVAQRGITGLWQGYGPTLLRDGPGMGFYFLFFELARNALVKDGESPTLPKLLLAGSTAGIGFWLWALPVDTVKSVMQTAEPGVYKGVAHCVGELTKAQGVGRLFRGWQAAFIRGIPGASVTLATHTAVVNALKD